MPLLVAAVSGLLMRLAFPPVEWALVAWVAMAPFLYQLFSRSIKEGFWLGTAFGLTFFYSNLFWLNSLHVFHPVAPLGILGLAAVCAVFAGLFGALSAVAISRTPTARLLFVPLCWVLVETLRSTGQLGFPWIYPAHTQVQVSVVMQVVEWTGTAGLSGMIVLVNFLLADAWHRRMKPHAPHSRWWIGWTVATVLIGATIVLGWVRLKDAPPVGESASGFVVGVVQPGIPQVEKMDSVSYFTRKDVRDFLQDKARRLFEAQLTGLAAERRGRDEDPADLYLLPESALVNEYFSIDPAQQQQVHRWAQAIEAPILFGATRVEDDGDFFNSAFLAHPESGVHMSSVYDKMHLVPFGEYSSYFDIIPGFTNFILGIAEFTPGEAPRPQLVGDRWVGPLICFESCFPYLLRKYEKAGVDVYAVLTNDAWYGTSSGPRRHQTQSIFRAIESRRPVIRVANTGISCMIDPFGRISYDSLDLEEGVAKRAFWEVPFRPEGLGEGMTFYMRYGEWLALVALLYCGTVLSVIYLRSRRGKMARSDA